MMLPELNISSVQWLRYLNGSVCALLAAWLMWCVMSVRVNDRLFIKLGLISMIVGFGFVSVFMFAANGVPVDPLRMNRALACIFVGLVISVSGYVYRRWRAGRPIQKITDYVPFDSLPSPMWTDTRPHQ